LHTIINHIFYIENNCQNNINQGVRPSSWTVLIKLSLFNPVCSYNILNAFSSVSFEIFLLRERIQAYSEVISPQQHEKSLKTIAMSV